MGYTVERADLRAWANEVGMVSSDMKRAHGYAERNITDGDFGKILEVITDSYEKLMPKFHAALRTDYLRLAETSDALAAAERQYLDLEKSAATQFAKLDKGDPGEVKDDGAADRFSHELAGYVLGPPNSEIGPLPEVSFGWALDTSCELISYVGGPDVREDVAKWITGDVEKAARQADAWSKLAECTTRSRANLTSGQQAIDKTWTGDGAEAAGKHMSKWTDSFSDQADAMRQMR